MSILSDLINGKELGLSDGSKLTISYQQDANVLALSIAGNEVILSSDDMNKLLQIESLLRFAKSIEAKA